MPLHSTYLPGGEERWAGPKPVFSPLHRSPNRPTKTATPSVMRPSECCMQPLRVPGRVASEATQRLKLPNALCHPLHKSESEEAPRTQKERREARPRAGGLQTLPVRLRETLRATAACALIGALSRVCRPPTPLILSSGWPRAREIQRQPSSTPAGSSFGQCPCCPATRSTWMMWTRPPRTTWGWLGIRPRDERKKQVPQPLHASLLLRNEGILES